VEEFSWFDNLDDMDGEKENVTVKQEPVDVNVVRDIEMDIPDLFDDFPDFEQASVPPQQPVQMTFNWSTSPVPTPTPPPAPVKFNFKPIVQPCTTHPLPAESRPTAQQTGQQIQTTAEHIQPAGQQNQTTAQSSQSATGEPNASIPPSLPFQLKPTRPVASLNHFMRHSKLPAQAQIAQTPMERPIERMQEETILVPPTADSFVPFTLPPALASTPLPSLPIPTYESRRIPGPAGNLPPISDQEREVLLRSRTTLVKLPRTNTEKARQAQAKSGEFAYLFEKDPWQSALAEVVHMEVELTGCEFSSVQSKLGNMLLYVRLWRVEDGFGYGAFLDPTGQVDGLATKRVLDSFELVEGCVILLRDVSVLGRKHLIVTPANVLRVFPPAFSNPDAVERALRRS
jgi:hypothetical protein